MASSILVIDSVLISDRILVSTDKLVICCFFTSPEKMNFDLGDFALFNGGAVNYYVIPDRIFCKSVERSVQLPGVLSKDIDVKPRVLVLGFYDECNLGDDAFKDTLAQILFLFTCEFRSATRLLPSYDSYSAIVFGGGNLLEEFFIGNLREIRKLTSIPIYGFGVEMQYDSYLSTGFTSLFEHIFTRNKKNCLRFKQIMGDQYASYVPDIVFGNNDRLIKKSPPVTTKIGVFLATPMMTNEAYVEQVIQALQYASSIGEVTLVSFNTSNNSESDLKISSYMHNIFPDSKLDTAVYTCHEMLNRMRDFTILICSRFHSHVLAMIAGIPFVSISCTSKVENLLSVDLNKLGMNCVYSSNQTFDWVFRNRQLIEEEFSRVVDENKRAVFATNICKLISTREYRQRKNPREDTLAIYDKCRQHFIALCGHDPEIKSDYKMSVVHAKDMAHFMCKMATGREDSVYLYGACTDVREKSWEMKEMIFWIIEKEQEKLSEG